MDREEIAQQLFCTDYRNLELDEMIQVEEALEELIMEEEQR